METEIKIDRLVPFDPESLKLDEIFNFDEMREHLAYSKDTFTVHPYPKNDFEPIPMLETLEMWGIDIRYHCDVSKDFQCLVDVYVAALERIDKEFKKRLGRKWGMYIMPDGYNLAVVHDYEKMIKPFKRLQKSIDSRNSAVHKRDKLSKLARRAIAASGKK